MTAANLVPSAHIATEVQIPPQNKARTSSKWFEVSDPMNNERTGESWNFAHTSLLPSADVETE
jgi:hypothetical protein